MHKETKLKTGKTHLTQIQKQKNVKGKAESLHVWPLSKVDGLSKPQGGILSKNCERVQDSASAGAYEVEHVPDCLALNGLGTLLGPAGSEGRGCPVHVGVAIDCLVGELLEKQSSFSSNGTVGVESKVCVCVCVCVCVFVHLFL